MLRDKGIVELVEAARLLERKGVALRVRLVGSTDDNPASIDAAQLAEWQAEGVVDVAGPSTDIPGEYARAHIAVLPSYREGLPKSLLEAAAAGLGVAIAPQQLVADDLAAGRLVAPWGFVETSARLVLWRPLRSRDNRAERLAQWLAGELGDSRNGHAP
jgi:glycosyltransferase involved in cell wall biosynthesis